MNNTLSLLWEKTLNIVKTEVTEVGFNTWLKTITPVKVFNNNITLGVPNEFNKGIVEGRYIPLIKNALSILTSTEYNISIIVMDEEHISAEKNTSFKKNFEDQHYHDTLNPKYTFETFVVGNSNQFAHAASLAVAETPAKSYNPLFLYGGVGLGKTHLMQAIGHYILNQNPSAKVVYVSAEKFTNELVNSIKDDKNEEFRNRYRTMDVLLMDDIQFIGGKERTQEEFFHTFNTLYESNKQIILTSDRPPKEISPLEDRLRSRFEWGLIGDIQPPDLETRIAILKKKAQMESLSNVPDDILVYVANKVKSNIRELEGALNRIIAFSALVEKEISQELADEALKDFMSDNKAKIITYKVIQDAVSSYFDVKTEDLKSKKRTKNISYPRQIAMYLCRKITDLSLPKIGDAFGGKDHTTVLHAVNKISKELEESDELKNIIEEISKNIKG
jgi:chromosomal replication initiator protein